MKLIIMTLIVDICRLTVTVREGGLEAQAKLYVVVKDVNDNDPTFEVHEPVHIDLVQVFDRQPLPKVEEYTVNRGEVDMVSEGEELIKVGGCFLILRKPEMILELYQGASHRPRRP